MKKLKTTIKKWGNSHAVIIPQKIVQDENLKEGLEITITIEPNHKMTIGDLIEFVKKHPLKKINKTTQEIIEEIDKDLWNEE